MSCQAPGLTISQYVTRMCVLYFRIFLKCLYYSTIISIKGKVGI